MVKENDQDEKLNHPDGRPKDSRPSTASDPSDASMLKETGAIEEGSSVAETSTDEILNVDLKLGAGRRRGGDWRSGSEVATRGNGRKRSAYATRDLTTGSVSKNLWFLAWPQMIEGVLNMVDRVADLFWAGRFFGFEAIAGLAAAQLYTNLVMTGRMGLDMGMQAMIARAIGAGRVELANHVALQAFSITVLFSLLMVTVGVLFTDFLLRILGVTPEVIGVVSVYMQIQFIGFGGQAFRMMTGSALQAAGDPLTPMKATSVSRIAHILLTPILIFGWWGAPEMGLAGAALANVAAQSLGVAWNSYALFNGPSRLHLTLRGYYIDIAILKRLIRIGAPASLTGMERSIVHLLLARIVTPFGSSALAAYGLTRNLEMFTALGSMGIGRASGTLVGQSLGAGNEERAKKTILWAIAYTTVIRGAMGILLLAFPALFVSIFNNQPEFVAIAVLWVRIQAIGGLVMGSGMVFQQSFNVAGDTVAPLIVTLIAMVGIELPLAFALANWTQLGQYGIPVAITVAMIARTALYFPYFFKGRWLRVKVID
ncbi:MAG: MATE family efflux transporter [Chloroflexota bacterium]|nr:MATE family efflux transporter [Chloroflexota bacterium]